MELEYAALQLAISSLPDEALILLLKNKCDWSTRISRKKFSKDEEEKIVRRVIIEPDHTGVFLYISYYFPEIGGKDISMKKSTTFMPPKSPSLGDFSLLKL